MFQHYNLKQEKDILFKPDNWQCFFSKKFTKASLASIGTKIGHRDHATVLHACKTVDNLAFTDKQFRKYVEHLDKKFTD